MSLLSSLYIRITYSKHKLIASDRGVILPLIALLLITFITFSAFVVDHSMQQVAIRQLKNSVDAAAHAGASYLNGTSDGWFKAKRAAVAVLRESWVLGSDRHLADFTLSDPEGILDPNESEPDYKSTRYSSSDGSLVITIERGRYWTPPNSETPTWEQVEDKQKDYQMPVYMTAHAMKVTMRVNGLNTIFANIGDIGISSQSGQAESVALFDDISNLKIAPVAIPACDLLFSMHESDHQSDHYIPSRAYNRPLVIGGVFHSFYWARPEVVHGLSRYLAYLPPAYEDGDVPAFTSQPIPIYGVLGTFGSEPRTQSEIDDVTEALEGGASVKLGQFFYPVKNTTYLDNAPFADAVARKITTSATTFTAAFGELEDDPETFWFSRYPWLPWFPLPRNYPAPNLFGTWNNYYWLNGLRNRGDFTNPMCHDRDRLGPPNRSDQGVWEVIAAVIAPDDENRFTGLPEVSYCGWANFEPERQFAPPDANTAPRVVGLIKLYIYGANTMSIPGSRPTWWDPSMFWTSNNGSFADDDNYMGQPAGFRRAWIGPWDQGYNPEDLISDSTYLAFLQSLIGDFSLLPGQNPPLALPPGVLPDECDYGDQTIPPPFPLPPVPPIPHRWGQAVEDKHCIPHFNRWNGFCDGNYENFLCWSYGPTAPQYGCGGLDARVTGDDKSFPSDASFDKSRPTIVE